MQECPLQINQEEPEIMQLVKSSSYNRTLPQEVCPKNRGKKYKAKSNRQVEQLPPSKPRTSRRRDPEGETELKTSVGKTMQPLEE